MWCVLVGRSRHCVTTTRISLPPHPPPLLLFEIVCERVRILPRALHVRDMHPQSRTHTRTHSDTRALILPHIYTYGASPARPNAPTHAHTRARTHAPAAHMRARTHPHYLYMKHYISRLRREFLALLTHAPAFNVITYTGSFITCTIRPHVFER